MTKLLAAVGLIRPARARGFCPACRGWVSATGDLARSARHDVDPAAVASLLTLAVAGLAWLLTIEQSRAMAAMGTATGPGALPSFAMTWLVMMAAMMLPSALPLVYEFAHTAQGRSGWQIATATLAVVYLSVWLVFGLLCDAGYHALHMPWANQRLIGGLALLLAGLYAMTPIERASEARCRALCALHDPLPFNLLRGALVAGVRYGLSCMGCTAGLMVAVVLMGMTSPGWMVIMSGLVLVSKLAPLQTGRHHLLRSLAIAGLGLVFMIGSG